MKTKVIDFLEKRVPPRYFNRIMCIYRNIFKNTGFTQSYQQDYFRFTFDDTTTVLSYDHEFQNDFLFIVPGYLARYSLEKEDIIVDAGAFWGSFTLYAAKKVGINGKVIAFEPDKKNYEKLMKNIRLNKMDNIIVIQKGLYDTNTKMFFDYSGQESHLISGDSAKHSHSGECIEVTTLDETLKEFHINKVNFIKMDVEGAEVKALLGCRNTLETNSVNLAIACYHIIEGKPTCGPVAELLSTFGYNAEKGHPIHLTSFAWKRGTGIDRVTTPSSQATSGVTVD